MMRTPTLLLGSFTLLLTAVACGGNVVVDLPSAGTGAGGATSSSTSTQGTGMGGTNNTVGVTGTTVGVGAGPGTSTSVTTGTVSPVTAVSSSSGGPPVQVSCNGMMCTPGQICCFNPTAPGDHCGESGQCGTGFVELTCNSPDDCPGSLCCAMLSNDAMGPSLQGTSCQTTCGGMDELVVCAQMQANVCPMGTGCHQQPQLGVGNGYRFCIP